jgi:hypothetical protein
MSSPERSFRRRLKRERDGKHPRPRGADAQAFERTRQVPAEKADAVVGAILASMRSMVRPRARG